jgi:transposase
MEKPPKLPTPEEVRDIYRQGEDAVVRLIEDLVTIIRILAEENQKLKDQLAKNSGNSSKPPSSDGVCRLQTRSLRKSSKRFGGQRGHTGDTLKPVNTPDHTVKHKVERCGHCGCSIKGEQPQKYEKRQVFDVPPCRLEVTEHQAEIKICPKCGGESTAEFPPDVTSQVQYGSRIKGFATYFNGYQYLPLDRTCEAIEDLFGHRVSETTIMQMNEELANRVKPSLKAVKQQLIDCKVLNNDETGMRVAGKLHWLHVAANARLTYYDFHEKRGKEATDDIGILPYFRGTSVHDYWKPYLKYKCGHSLCNAHLLRDIVFIVEQYRQSWAGELKTLLLDIKEKVDETRPCKDHLTPSVLKAFEKQYDKIVRSGFRCNPPPTKKPARGKAKQTPPRNLLDRLKTHKRETLTFMRDFSVPFDNNQAERDVRMMKVKQKISGCFRTLEGAKRFCQIRSYISTSRKNEVRIIEAIQAAFNGNPFIPQIALVTHN